MKKDLSVIIPVYNAGLLIDRCLDSIFAQSGGYQVEVICIDDGSTDNSAEIIRKRKEPSIRLLTQPNSGPACARNKGIAAAEGRYIAFLDADDYWLPEFVQETLSFLDKHEDCIAVSVMQRHITMSGDHISPKDIPAGMQLQVLDDFYDFWAKYNHVCTGSIAIRSEIAKATGGQREELRICEDLEFWAYLATFGKIGFIPKLLFVSDGNKVVQKIGWVEKNKKRWDSASTVEEWEKRLIERSSNLTPSYRIARGRIARNLCYSILMSKRKELAYRQIKKYSGDFPAGLMTTVMRLATKNRLFWWIISNLLIQREYRR